MTPLREKMQEDLQLHGLSNLTQDLYIRAVRQLAEYYRKSPDQITEEELRQYFLYLKNDKQYAPSTLTVALCGIRFDFSMNVPCSGKCQSWDSCVPPFRKGYPSYSRSRKYSTC